MQNVKRRIAEAREQPRKKPHIDVVIKAPLIPLLDYQKDILMHIARIESSEITNPRMTTQGCILWAEMGIGKTVIALALMYKPHVLPSLYVTTFALLETFLEELKKFYGTHLRVLVYHNKHKKTNDFTNYDVVLTTYTTLTACEEPDLFEFVWHRIILDESHTIRNKIASFDKLMTLKTSLKLCMTGTPLYNLIRDVFVQLEFLGLMIPEHLRRDESLIDEWGLRPFIIQRKREDVNIILPKKHVNVRYIDLNVKERYLHDKLIAHRSTEPAFLVRALQVCTAPYLMTPQSKRKSNSKIPFEEDKEMVKWLLESDEASVNSSKMKAFNHVMRELSGTSNKIIVFANMESTLHLAVRNIKQSCSGFDTMHALVSGQSMNRSQQLKRFKDDPQCRVLFMTLGVGAQGFNLTHANVVVFLEPWYTDASHQQGESRVHRMGQTKEVHILYLVARDSADQEVYELAQSKKHLSEQLECDVLDH